MKTSRREFVWRARRLLVIVGQLVVVAFSNYAAFLLRFDGHPPGWAAEAFWRLLPWIVAVRAVTFLPFRLYQGLWRYTSIYDLQALGSAVMVSTVGVFVMIRFTVGFNVYPRSVPIIDAIILMLLLGGMRLTWRLRSAFLRNEKGKRVLIYGAGSAGELIVRDMRTNLSNSYRPIGFIDDNPIKLRRSIHGVRVLGTREHLEAIVEKYRPHEILIAMPGAPAPAVRSIVKALEPYRIPIKTLPNLRDILHGRVEVSLIRNLALEDLLQRAPIGLSMQPVDRLLHNKRVMVTGAGGSIGSELARQIAAVRPASLILLDRYENSLHAVQLELERGRAKPEAVIADITDAVRIDGVMKRYRPEVVFHAAAHKHVPLMEANPAEAVKNNIRGTRILAEAADKYHVRQFVLISTDKAANPTSIMGATKRIAEQILLARTPSSRTMFSIVRFGNVLGSNGSVVPLFMEQISRGGPVTVTHPDVRRYFMLIPEAVQLVLHAAAHPEAGGVFVLDMGEQVKLVDLARNLIRLAGRAPDEDVAIEFVGLRPGEKLEEELLGRGEELTSSVVHNVMRVRNATAPPRGFHADVTQLEHLAATGDERAVAVRLKEMVGMPQRKPDDVETRVPRPLSSYRTQQQCPRCRGHAARSPSRGLFERMRKSLTDQRLFECEACGWRGWRIPMVTPSGESSGTAVSAPDLAALDRFLD